jgi:hypothetical protein
LTATRIRCIYSVLSLHTAASQEYPMDTTLYADRITPVDPAQIVPFNPVEKEKVEALAEAMKRDGWVGRPVLAVEDNEGVRRGLTASHRLAAACRVLDTVPVVVVAADDLGLECDGEDVYVDGERVADIDSLRYLLSTADSDDARVAVALLTEEEEANARDDASLAA